MIPVRLAANAANDITTIAQTDPQGAARVFALVNEMNSNPKLQDMLLDRKNANPPWNSQRWVAAYGQGKNLYRLKEIDARGYSANNYRIIYAYITNTQWREELFVVLAVAERDKFNYELHHPLSKRIYADYNGFD